MQLYNFQEPTGLKQPILINYPHSGTAFPDEVKDQYLPEQLSTLDDTDWFLPEIYQFAAEMGISQMQANYHRWLIDLNRDPESKALYNDGRHLTGLCSETDFLGNKIYRDGEEPGKSEVNRRLANYYWPYYHALQQKLDNLKAEFGFVILYDAHSIRSVVKTIRKQRFPDIILGTADNKSADSEIINTASDALLSGHYQINFNDPFKGGHITRYFGEPSEQQHALQLERCKDLYMDESETKLDTKKASEMAELLKSVFENLIRYSQERLA